MEPNFQSNLDTAGFCEHGYAHTECRFCRNTSERSQEQRFDDVERARVGVEQAVLLDVYLENDVPHSLEDFLLTYSIAKEEITAGLQQRFIDVIQRWNTIADTHAKIEAELDRLTFSRFGDHWSTNVGKIIFSSIVSNDFSNPQYPKGNIEAVRRGPLYVMFFDNPEDYARIHKGNSGGTYHRAESTSLELPNFSLNVNILMVNGERHNDYSYGTVSHERQHFINDIWMRKTPGTKFDQNGMNLLSTREDWIKDEVLAYLKEGSDSETFRVLRGELYGHLFSGLKDSDAKKMDDTLEEIIDAMKTLEAYFPTKNSRALLVYHLIDTPYQRIPEVLRLLCDFEEHRGNPASTFEIPGKNSEFLNDGIIPPDDDDY